LSSAENLQATVEENHFKAKAKNFGPIARSFVSASIPVTKEPNGISHTDGKRPDGMTGSLGRRKTPDMGPHASIAGSAAVTAAERKTAKYADLGAQFLFQPIAAESPGPMYE